MLSMSKTINTNMCNISLTDGEEILQERSALGILGYSVGHTVLSVRRPWAGRLTRDYV